MCGLVVRAGFESPWSDAYLEPLRSRGPDHSGVWKNNEIQIGHTLLSNIGGQAEGGQPKFNQRYVLAFNGLIANHEELANRYGTNIQSRAGKSTHENDSATLLNLWTERGEAVLPEFTGFWAFSIYDMAAKTITLVRDQFGAKPLYYWSDGRRFCAASTIKALLRAIGFVPELDYQALAEYARYQLSFGEKTFFCGIRRVMPGHTVQFNLNTGHLESRCWEDIFAPVGPPIAAADWSGHNGGLSPKPSETWVHETRELMEAGVRQYTQGRRPWTVLTAGGIDSTIITRMTQPDQAFHSYFSNPACNELAFAQAAVEGISTQLVEVHAEEDFNLVDRLDSIIEGFDDPSVGSVVLPMDGLLRQLGKKHRVVLTGAGGDELFGGYVRYSLARGGAVQASYGKLKDRLAAHNSLVDRFELTHLKGESSWYRFDTGVAKDNFIAAFESGMSPHLSGAEAEQDAMLRFDRRHFLRGLLNIDDRISGRYGVESRPALLNQHFVRQINAVPSQAIFNQASMKGLLKQIGAPYLPRAISDRKDKMGFTTPIGSFVQRSSAFIDEQLRESRFRHLYALPDGPLPARDIYSREVFGLLVLDLWLNRYASPA